jgi:tRNA (adenine22-N1)-methyltransferase
MKIELSQRLSKLAELVLPGKTVADIGTDHGYLPVYLVVNKICPQAIATDRVSGPLSSAQHLAELLYLNKRIDFRLGEGLEVLRPGEAATICLAGMGGCAICAIMQDSLEVAAKTKRFVLQPQRNAAKLRYYLSQNDWRIVAEDLVFDSGFYYQMMAVEPGSMDLSPQEAEFGPLLVAQKHPLLRSYLKNCLEDNFKVVAKLKHRSQAAVQARLEELQQQRKVIEELVFMLNE